ncbi:hypothetical protein V2A60_004197 [Cordyceps javanica]
MHFLSNAAAILTVINYFAPKPNCSHGEPRVGICLVEKCDSSPGADGLKAVQPVERTSDFQIRTVKFNNTELGPGEYRAAFVCEDGENPPWMLSRSFTVDAAPPAEEGKCVHRSSTFSPAWKYTACDKVPGLCHDCDFSAQCGACLECQDQCGL